MLTEENKKTAFGQELLTQELVTYEKVHANVTQELIIITEDRMHLWLREVMLRARKQFEWIAPLSLTIAITLTLTTTSFKKLLLTAETWHAIFIIVDIISFCWLIASLRHLRRPVDLAEEISTLKTFSPTQLSKNNERGGKS